MQLHEKLEYIESLLERRKLNQFGEDKYLISAILNTVAVADLVDLYLETSNLDLRKSLDYHLSRRFSESSLNHIEIFDYLIKKIGKSNYSVHQRSRVLLTYLVDRVPKKYVRKFFVVFSSSRYATDIKAALKVADKVWRSGSENLFIDEYFNSGNEKYLIAVLNNGKPDLIANRLREIWEEDSPENYIKNKIIRKLTPAYFENFQFLKDNEPDKYLYACAFAGKSIENNELKNIYNRLNNEQKTFALWCIGKMGNWDFIKTQIDQLEMSDT